MTKGGVSQVFGDTCVCGHEGPLLSEWPVPRFREWVAHVNRPQTEVEVQAIQRCIRRSRPFGGEQWTVRIVPDCGFGTRNYWSCPRTDGVGVVGFSSSSAEAWSEELHLLNDTYIFTVSGAKALCLMHSLGAYSESTEQKDCGRVKRVLHSLLASGGQKNMRRNSACILWRKL